MQSDAASLLCYESHNASLILGWVESAEQLWHWAARRDFPLIDSGVFCQWHADPDITPYQLIIDGELVGYGELWCESAEPWAEMGRLIIAPKHRNRGLGRLLIANLAHKVRQLGFHNVWVRVCPTNAAAIACYLKAGFMQASEAEQQELNATQQHAYAWMKLPLGTADAA